MKRHLFVPGVVACLLGGLVACTSSSEPDDPTGTGGVAWTTSGSGGDGGSSNGGASSTSASGGASSTSASGGAGVGGSGGGGAGAGGAGPATAILIASGGSGVLQASFDGVTWSATTAVSPTSSVAPAVSVAGGVGLGVVAADASTLDLPVTFATFAGGWGAFGSSGALTRAGLSLASGALAYHAPDYKHAFALFAGSWSPIDEAIAPPAEPQSFGPTAPRVAVLAGDPVVAFAGDDHQLYVQTRSAGAWSAAAPIAGAAVEAPPAIVALASGPELLAVWVNHAPSTVDHTKLYWSSRTAGVWSTPAKIDEDVFTPEAPNLAALAGGDALLAFRGSDGKGYTLRWTGSWSSVLPLQADVLTTPAVCAGAPGADAELALVAPGGAVEHLRLTGTSWSAPTPVGGAGLLHAAVAALP